MFEEDPEAFALTAVHIARDLHSQRTVSDVLHRVTQLAVEQLAGCHHAGVLLVRPGRRVETAAATSQLVTESNQAQGDLGEGPCFDAARENQPYRVIDMRGEKRWPSFAPQARKLGIGAMMGFRLFADSERLGALDLYSERPYTFTPKTEQMAWILASHAAIAITASRGGDLLHIDE